jgi:hypothetical protein
MMANAMFRTPKRFNPVEAFNLLCKDANILWCPYKPSHSKHPGTQSPPWVSRIFFLSVRRGLLPFRRADLCIAEPYHPDRVARQFKLDQVLPYPPLVDVYTEEDFGVAYAYWAHLL